MTAAVSIRLIALFGLAAFVFGCGSHSGALPPVSTSGVSPFVQQQQGSGPWLTYATSFTASAVALGRDGNVWYCEGSLVGRISMTGVTTDFPLPSATCLGITPNPDGNEYFGESGGGIGGIGQITPQGAITLFAGPESGAPSSIETGSDGNVWAVHAGHVWRMTTQGVFTDFSSPGVGGTVGFNQLVRGSDKNLWTFGHSGVGWAVWRIGMDGSTTAFPLSQKISGIASGSDGGIWISQGAHMVRLDPTTGQSISYQLSRVADGYDLTEGPHHLLYFVDRRTTPFTLGRFDIVKLKLRPNQSLANASFGAMTFGPDSNAWITDTGVAQLHVFVVDAMSTDPTSISVAVGSSASLTASEKGVKQPLSASSSDSNVATVSSNGDDSFTVNGVAIGSCTITVSDSKGNSLDVPVTVN